ncbi:acyltransferase [Polymorphobacter glacialis]|uniref:Acyltransferase n=1 Tax=Sandarakinorhabdus glacialis TaxID=1614636 RepID=A0A916ZWA7_9SPHN|nr:acyltransferase [Polymorphobacter glacialis]GGE16809.1 acyltransferase [Polymorphobacter glacialis]
MTAGGPPTASAPRRYEALDGLRGVCALLVCLFHFRANGPIASLEFIRGSWLFVDFFFVLAGFVIAASYRERLTKGQFLYGFAILRFGRVYPLHLFMLVIFVVFELFGLALSSQGLMQRQPFDPDHSFLAIFTSLALIQAFGLHDGLTWNHPSWSVAVEFWTYVGFALLARWAGAALEKWLVVVAVLCVVVLASVTDYGMNVTYRWSLFRCIYGFAIGALVWWLWSGLKVAPSTRLLGGTSAELLAVALVVGYVTWLSNSRANLLSPLVFGAVVLVFAQERGAVSRLLMTAPLRRLGLLSYSIYMVHVFIQSRMDDAVRVTEKLTGMVLTIPRGALTLVGGTPLEGVLFTVLMLAIVVAVSHVTLKMVEEPGRRWSQRVAAAGHGLPSRVGDLKKPA